MAMNINDSFRYMQDYRINDIPRVDAPKPEPAQVKENTEAAKPSVTIEPIEDRRPKSVDPNEVSLSFNKNNDYGYGTGNLDDETGFYPSGLSVFCR